MKLDVGDPRLRYVHVSFPVVGHHTFLVSDSRSWSTFKRAGIPKIHLEARWLACPKTLWLIFVIFGVIFRSRVVGLGCFGYSLYGWCREYLKDNCSPSYFSSLYSSLPHASHRFQLLLRKTAISRQRFCVIGLAPSSVLVASAKGY